VVRGAYCVVREEVFGERVKEDGTVGGQALRVGHRAPVSRVGMVLDTDCALLRRATRLVFGIPQESVLVRYEQGATAAGLRATATARNGKGLGMPVVISEKGGQIDHAPPDDQTLRPAAAP
jgi:hypothetical protein